MTIDVKRKWSLNQSYNQKHYYLFKHFKLFHGSGSSQVFKNLLMHLFFLLPDLSAQWSSALSSHERSQSSKRAYSVALTASMQVWSAPQSAISLAISLATFSWHVRPHTRSASARSVSTSAKHWVSSVAIGCSSHSALAHSALFSAFLMQGSQSLSSSVFQTLTSASQAGFAGSRSEQASRYSKASKPTLRSQWSSISQIRFCAASHVSTSS